MKHLAFGVALSIVIWPIITGNVPWGGLICEALILTFWAGRASVRTNINHALHPAAPTDEVGKS